MYRLCITDPDAGEHHDDILPACGLAIRSRSGLHPTELALIERLAARPMRRALVAGNRSGVLPMLIRHWNPDAAVTAHTFDLHHAETLRRHLAWNRVEGVEVPCTAFIDARELDLAALQLTRGDLPGELVMDLVQEIHDALRPDGTLFVAADPVPDLLRERLRESFRIVSTDTDRRWKATVFRATGPLPLKRRRDFTAAFDMTLPGREGALHLMSLPGTFAHRRVDEGAQALAEVVLKEAGPGGRGLDLGCGIGSVGLSLARFLPLDEIVLVDSHARAIHCTGHNAAANGIAGARVMLSHTGIPETAGRFDVVVGNPPYFSDYRIADLFLDTAHQALRPGGRVWMVAKNADVLAGHMQTRFGPVTLTARRGYQVAGATRRA